MQIRLIVCKFLFLGGFIQSSLAKVNWYLSNDGFSKPKKISSKEIIWKLNNDKIKCLLSEVKIIKKDNNKKHIEERDLYCSEDKSNLVTFSVSISCSTGELEIINLAIQDKNSKYLPTVWCNL